jgi:hypothetical protein
LNELYGYLVSTFLAIVVPGVAFLFASRARFARWRVDATLREDKSASFLGWLFIALACSFLLLMQLMTAGSSGPGGLGSQGNPLAVLVLLGYAFVVAPAAWILLIVFVIAWAIARAKQKRLGS